MQSSAKSVTLDDRWDTRTGRILINGTQAIARVLLAQKERDRALGLNTAGLVTGYRGSPLGNVDSTLWSIAKRLEDASIRFVPSINEDMAATVVRGTQQLAAVDDALVDGVFAAWYGKGPGVDRAGDALKHGNLHGSHPNGGAVVFYGDDHGGKSSSVAHHSEQAVAAALIPSLYPANVAEIIEYGLLGYAMSRYSGAWVGLKLVNEVAEQTASVDIDLVGLNIVTPEQGALPPEGIHARPASFGPLREEQIATEHRLPLVLRFVRANRIDRVVIRADRPVLGLVTCGKSHGETMQALDLLGLDARRAALLGISVYKVGCIWPLEPEGIREFAAGHRALFFIEEKQAFVEPQAAMALVNETHRPLFVGKTDETGAPLLPLTAQLDPRTVALAIAGQLRALGMMDTALDRAVARLTPAAGTAPALDALPKRSPYFCSGCPHSRSTRVPEGSLSLTGIGCHTMVNFVRPTEALPPTHMGGEGGNWIGLAPFVGTKHIFQNMGDGTYFHSGLLAIRAAIASGVNITYKILYNDAVAMTGGQPVDGPLSVPDIVAQVRAEGVAAIHIVSDDPERWRGHPDLPSGTAVHHRDELDGVQRAMREIPGCSILIYEQTCAAEKRRRRKRGLMPDPAKRMFIAEEVCEGCGDCSAQSSCVSIVPVETEHGTKRAIDQSSCNKDYSCNDGFCPSFITVKGAGPRKPVVQAIDAAILSELPAPEPCRARAGSYNVMIAGIGGTGVITVAAIIGMAAHIDGRAASLFDMTGLSQKNGAVFSHVRLADRPNQLHAQKIGTGEADALLAMDAVAALADECRLTLAGERTRVVMNDDTPPTVAFQFNRDARIETNLLTRRLEQAVGPEAVETLHAGALSTRLLGDSIGANMMLVGMALQRGLLPVTVAAMERAIELNGTAVKLNLQALRIGRAMAAFPERILEQVTLPQQRRPLDLEALIAHRAAHLEAYQDKRLSRRYTDLVERVRRAEAAIVEGDALTRAVATNYARVLAIKDEYEVARLLSSDVLWDRLASSFEDGATFSFNMAPPLLPGRTPNGRPRKRAFSAATWRPVLKGLAALRGVRNTPFDPFGYTAERRAERGLARHYETLVDQVLARLTPANHADAVQVLQRVAEVRGFGPVKLAALDAYHADLPALMARLDAMPTAQSQARVA